MMIEGIYEKESRGTISLPKGSRLDIQETSNGVYQINLIDKHGRSVSNHGIGLDEMVENAIIDLKRMSL